MEVGVPLPPFCCFQGECGEEAPWIKLVQAILCKGRAKCQHEPGPLDGLREQSYHTSTEALQTVPWERCLHFV